MQCLVICQVPGVIRSRLSSLFYMKNELCESRVSFNVFSSLLLRLNLADVRLGIFTVIIWIFLIKCWNVDLPIGKSRHREDCLQRFNHFTCSTFIFSFRPGAQLLKPCQHAYVCKCCLLCVVASTPPPHPKLCQTSLLCWLMHPYTGVQALECCHALWHEKLRYGNKFSWRW